MPLETVVSRGVSFRRQSDQIRLQLLKQEYTRFSKAAKLPMQYERMEAAGFTWKHGKAAEKTAARVEAEERARLEAELQRKKNLQFIKDDAIIKAASGLPKKLEGLPDEILQHTVSVNIDPSTPNGFEFHGVAPKKANMTKVEVMAGAGTSTPIRDLRRLYMTYDRSPEGWQKKSGTVYGKEYHYVIHWYEHSGFVPKDEIKLKGMNKNK